MDPKYFEKHIVTLDGMRNSVLQNIFLTVFGSFFGAIFFGKIVFL